MEFLKTSLCMEAAALIMCQVSPVYFNNCSIYHFIFPIAEQLYIQKYSYTLLQIIFVIFVKAL